MIIAQLVGGLGNQLFQYAACRALALRVGHVLKFDAGHYAGTQRPDALVQYNRSLKLANFNLSLDIATPQEIRAIRDRYMWPWGLRAVARGIRQRWPRCAFGLYRERSCNFDAAVLTLPDNVYIEGYLQSEKYFADFQSVIRRELTFRDPSIQAYATQYLGRMRRADHPIVAVHLRRGDLAYSVEKLKNPKLVYGPPVTIEYIRAAMQQFDPDCTFLVFSDTTADLDWCKQRLSAKNIHFSYGHSDLQDFAIMRACDHQVISNSTFSWWAAWLNENPAKRVIAPSRWFDQEFYPDYDPHSLIPETWTIL